MSLSRQNWGLHATFVAVACISSSWYKLVTKHVPEPYLDEVFHVPQAQRYYKRDYTWDPKITTPPGLYLLGEIPTEILGRCDTSSLRLVSVVALWLLYLNAYAILVNLRWFPTTKDVGEDKKELSNTSNNDGEDPSFDIHSALNIALFPPLFFFSGLYYTDVASTLLVLESYRPHTFLTRESSNRSKGSIYARFKIAFSYITPLLFRQTNIFWVAVFPAGLAAVEALKKNGTFTSDPSRMAMSPREILTQSWSKGRIYDPSVRDASFQDYVLASLTIGVAAIKAPFLVIKATVPYIILLGLFAGFVSWNGGVVLGDKSNHVATIHFPQMLYFWPYVVFFSFPLLLPILLTPIVCRLPNSRFKSLCQNHLTGQSNTSFPSIISASAITFITLGLAAVHFNTIVHPFTLADNRHYVFYVFRILMRHPAIKYLAVPFYYVCAWLVIQALGVAPQNFLTTELPQSTTTTTHKPSISSPKSTILRRPCPSSFVIVWLATTSLSVITAPLVEPRYFIIPWIMWRLHLQPSTLYSQSRITVKGWTIDTRLVIETVWYLTVNAVTGYMFLFKGFAWESEPGKVQRFMW